ncbi:MAG: hypothetical protein H7A33_00680 [Deltaproteobacteria bacterium]|nr:hypothetical protein [Deltaproteobacteria bacterium]
MKTFFWRAFASVPFGMGCCFWVGPFVPEIICVTFGHLPKEVVAFCFAPLVLVFRGSIATQSTTLVYEGVLSKDFEQTRARRALWGQNSITFLVSLVLATLVYAYGVLRFHRAK